MDRKILGILLIMVVIRTTHTAAPTITAFSPNTESIAENTLTQTRLATVKVSDPDGELITCRSSCTPTGPFTVWRDDQDEQYHVYFVVGAGVAKLDFSKTSEYNLTVGCEYSKDKQAKSEDLIIKILGNEPPAPKGIPAAQTISAKSAQFQTVNSIVYNLSTPDPENDVLKFVMYSDPDLGYFKIDPYTGQIKTAIDLRSATVSSIPLFINVTDGTNVVGPLKVTINLIDMNDRPVITNLPVDLSIKEDADEGQVITVLSFTDNNPYQTLEPICSVQPTTEKYKFTFEANSNKLRLATGNNEPKPLDYETTKAYNISCLIYDGYLYNEGDFIILNVIEVNEVPVFKDDSYSCVLYESDIAVSHCDLPMSVTDPDDDAVVIGLLSGNNSERFSLIKSNYDRRLTFNINYDVDENAMPSDVVLTAGAVDARGLTGTTKIFITILDKNDNTPEFTSSITSYVISETQAVGSLGTITALDRDFGTNGDITYTVKGGSTALGYVSMIGDGNIQYTNPYPESMGGKSETILVEAKDNGDPRLSSTGTVIVTFQPHSTTTTTTTTTTLAPITVLNTVTASTSFLDNSASIGLLAALLSLLLLGLIGLLVYFLCCRGGKNADTGRQVHPDDYDDRDYYDRDDDDRRSRRRNDDYDDRRSGSPYSTSQVKLIGRRDLPRIV